MKHSEIIREIEKKAPVSLQESYDNTGWQVGDPEQECTGVLINLDLTDSVIDEAIANQCNLVITHHPIIFGGIKKLIGRNYVEQLIIKAIKNDISVYACHTNLDNIRSGVNDRIAARLGLTNVRILRPISGGLYKLIVFVPIADTEKVRDAILRAGAGNMGHYSECSFMSSGQGTFRPGIAASPAIGKAGGEREIVEEHKLEFLVPSYLKGSVYQAMISAHPYEEVAHDWYLLDNANQDAGAGIVGELPEKMDKVGFLKLVKERMNADVIRFTDAHQELIQKIAVCGGSGSFLLNKSKSILCDAFVTADFKYHQFFDSEQQLMIVDIGHYESEQFTSEIFYDIIIDKFPNFAVRISKINTNPVKYYY